MALNVSYHLSSQYVKFPQVLEISLLFLKVIGRFFGNYKAISLGCSVKKSVFKGFAKFTEQHLYQGLFFNKVAG